MAHTVRITDGTSTATFLADLPAAVGDKIDITLPTMKGAFVVEARRLEYSGNGGQQIECLFVKPEAQFAPSTHSSAMIDY